MSNTREQNIKKFAYSLSKKVKEYLDVTPAKDLPLRPSQIRYHYEIKKLVKAHGYPTIYHGLKEIVRFKLRDFIPEMSVEETEKYGKVRHDWYFSKTTSIKPTTKPETTSNQDCKLHIDNDPSLYFSEAELAILTEHKGNFEKLINGKLKPKTELQKKFKQVANDLIQGVKEKDSPKGYFDKLIAKQLIFEFFIRGKK